MEEEQEAKEVRLNSVEGTLLLRQQRPICWQRRGSWAVPDPEWRRYAGHLRQQIGRGGCKSKSFWNAGK